MSEIISDLLPVVVGAALVPIYPIVILLLLQSKDGLIKALAFVLGGLALRLGQGLLFGFILGGAAAADTSPGPGPIAATLLLVIGILLLTSALKKWRKEVDPDEPPPKWMASLNGLSTPKALGAGALYVVVAVKQWVFTLTAISIIGEASLGTSTSTGLYLLFVLATQALVLPPILMFAIAPQQSAKPLGVAQAWLDRNYRVIVISVSLIFGLWFFYKGASGLLG